MAVLFHRNTETIKQVFDAFTNERLIVDQSYQRRKVWLVQDKIRLIETILLDLVVPEVFFWPAAISPDTGDTITHIVDGQQRITSIVEFIVDGFSLQNKYLMDDKIKTRCGNLFFSELPSEEKTRIWSYNISIVNIDKSFGIDNIKQMFYRLNLTNYNLNPEEKLNSMDSAFGYAASALATLDFWKDCRVFSAADARRMQDVRYCSSIYILANEGMVDETNRKKVDDYYIDFSEVFDADNHLYKRIELAMDIINKLKSKATLSFISKKAQMYTLFSFAFQMFDRNIPFSDEIAERFHLFVQAYSRFRNEFTTSFDGESLRMTNEAIKKYKLASSEGINKIGNRVIRYEIMYKICIESSDAIKTQLIALNSKYLEQAFSAGPDYDALDDEEKTDINDVV